MPYENYYNSFCVDACKKSSFPEMGSLMHQIFAPWSTVSFEWQPNSIIAAHKCAKYYSVMLIMARHHNSPWETNALAKH